MTVATEVVPLTTVVYNVTLPVGTVVVPIEVSILVVVTFTAVPFIVSTTVRTTEYTTLTLVTVEPLISTVAVLVCSTVVSPGTVFKVEIVSVIVIWCELPAIITPTDKITVPMRATTRISDRTVDLTIAFLGRIILFAIPC